MNKRILLSLVLVAAMLLPAFATASATAPAAPAAPAASPTRYQRRPRLGWMDARGQPDQLGVYGEPVRS